jgi:hypothetical protein
MIKASLVEKLVSRELVDAGFHKRRLRFTREDANAFIDVGIQRNSFGKEIHYLNFSVMHDAAPDIPRGEVFGRIESLDLLREASYLDALNDEIFFNDADRQAIISEMIGKVFLPFLHIASDIDAVRTAMRESQWDRSFEVIIEGKRVKAYISEFLGKALRGSGDNN